MKCLHDVLWPLPTIISYEFNGKSDAKLEFVVPGLEAIPDREASMASGNRVEIRRMSDISHTKLHNQHALGLVVRLLGELFASLPTIETVTVSALQVPTNGKPQRYIASAQAERSQWSSLHSNGSVTAGPGDPLPESAACALQPERARRVHDGRAVRLTSSQIGSRAIPLVRRLVSPHNRSSNDS